MTKPILDQFDSKDKHEAYREKVRQYADEEKRLWEDFRHGMIIRTRKFVDKIRSKYMPDHIFGRHYHQTLFDGLSPWQ